MGPCYTADVDRNRAATPSIIYTVAPSLIRAPLT